MTNRRLTLIRHAEAGSEHGSRIRDYNRPLTVRGRQDASRLGGHFAVLGIEPGRVWTSDAERALTTSQILAAAMELPPGRLEIRSGLYLAHMDTLRDFIREADADIPHLAVVGHNPGLSELWNWLCDKEGFGLPTCGWAQLELGISRWTQLDRGCAELLEFDVPEEEPSR